MQKVLLTLFMALLSIASWAYDANVDGIYYNLDAESQTAQVTKSGQYSSSYSGDIVIPSSIEYNETIYTVTSIGEGAFFNSSKLLSVTIPQTVTSIGDRAFTYCSNMVAIDIPNSVTSIGVAAFGMAALKSLEIPNSVKEIGAGAFNNCYALESITLPEGLEVIAENLFNGSTALTSVTIPDGVTVIENEAFTYCM